MNQTNTTLGLYHFAFLDGRLASFKQLRALGHALAGCGLPLSAFMISLHGCSVRPVQSGEVRVPLGGGRYGIHTGAGIVPELRPDFSFDSFKRAVHLVDQCGQGIAALWHLMRMGYAFWILQEFCHRLWNDVFLSLKHANGYPYQFVVMFTIIFNIPYGPFGSGVWHTMIVDTLEAFCQDEGAMSDTFKRFAPDIAADMQRKEPSTPDELQELLEALCNLHGIKTKGCHCKNSRWASFFEAPYSENTEVEVCSGLLCETG